MPQIIGRGLVWSLLRYAATSAAVTVSLESLRSLVDSNFLSRRDFVLRNQMPINQLLLLAALQQPNVRLAEQAERIRSERAELSIYKRLDVQLDNIESKLWYCGFPFISLNLRRATVVGAELLTTLVNDSPEVLWASF